MPISSREQYSKAQDLVSSGKAKDPVRLQASMRRWEHFAMPQSQAPVEGLEGTPLPALQGQADIEQANSADASRLQGQANKQGYEIDLSQPQPALENIATNPHKDAFLAKVREATEDPSLPNASKLKVFSDPVDYRPPQQANPFSALPLAPKDTQYFYEPSLAEFKEALKSGALGAHLKREFPNIPDPTRLIDKDIEGSKTFRAFQDAAWKHALADALRDKTPISRVAYSKQLGTFEKGQAQVLDPAVSAATGALSGATAGLADPILRLVAPEGAEAERRSRLRNPHAALGGEIAGALTPEGLPSTIARGSTKLLGKLGLESRGLAGAAKGIASAAATGAADANLRAISQSASDALDAGDTALEAAHRLYQTMNPEQSIPRTLAGAGLGAGLGAAGEGLGGMFGKAAEHIVGSDSHLPTLNNARVSGVKMSPTGEPVLPEDLQLKVNAARAKRADADVLLADEAVDPMASQRLSEQESAARRATRETSTAREKLKGATVPTNSIAEEIAGFAEEMPAMTPQAKAKQTSIRRYARMIRNRNQLTAKDLDDVISEVDSQANQDAKKPDSDWNRVSAIIRKGRDQLQFEEPTSVDNYAIRDKEGNVTHTSDYGGMKTRQSTEQNIQKFENRQMGLPPELKAAPVRVGGSSDAEAGDFLARHEYYPQLKQFVNEDRSVASDLENGVTSRAKPPGRTVGALQSQYGANKALIDAVENGHGYQGTVYRGARMSPEEIQSIVASGKVKNPALWSASKSPDHALSFAKKGSSGEPVLFEVEGSSGVSLDAVPGLNTFDEVAIPTGRTFKVTDSFRNKDGVLVMKLSDGTRGPDASEATALAEGTQPKARLDSTQRAEFSGKILGARDPANSIATEKLQLLAKRAGIPEHIPNIQRLHDAQNWKQMLGKAIQGIGVSKGGVGGSYLSLNQLIRAVPTLRSLSGGLPQMEASPEAVSLVERFLSEAVPSWRGANLRGGQGARPVGAIVSRNAQPARREDMSAEEAQTAAQIIKNLILQQQAQ